MHKHLSPDEKARAYRAIANRYYLRRQQRDALDAAPNFRAIREAAHEHRWIVVETLLNQAGIIHSEITSGLVTRWGA